MAVEPNQHAPASETSAVAVSPHSPAPPQRRPVQPKRSGNMAIWLGLVAILALGAGGYWLWGRQDSAAKVASKSKEPIETGPTTTVEVFTPVAGGIRRTSTQPGTLHAFESANLYAKLSGYLKVLNVDIGDRVKEGDLLAEIDDPEAGMAVEHATASLEQARAQVKQAEARLATAKADVKSAEADREKAKADVLEFTSRRTYRQSELNRIIELARTRSVERKLEDEERERYESAVAGETAAKANVDAAEAKVTSHEALVQQAEADILESKANVDVSQATLDLAKVVADYTRITSPYNGVITTRNFFRGDFIRSAADGNNMPILSVARTDKLRVVVNVPDRDVPFVDRGDPAEIHIDALPGRGFEGTIARFSESEDPSDRTMHTEIDLDSEGGRLREGMYGSVAIVLDPASDKALTIPSRSLIHQDGKGRGALYVVRDGKIARQDVRIGKDNGVSVEVLDGIKADDAVVVSYNGSISEGLAVKTEPSKVSGSNVAATH